MTRLALILAAVAVSHAAGAHRSWASDNGNGTYPRRVRLLPYRHHHARHARGARTIRIVELNADCTALVDDTDRVLLGPEQGMGEGSHIYKLNGKYYIVSTVPGAHVPMKCARAEKITGPCRSGMPSRKSSISGRRIRLWCSFTSTSAI